MNTVLSDVSQFGFHLCRVSKIVNLHKDKTDWWSLGLERGKGMEVQFGKMKYAGDEWCAVSLGCTLKKIKIGILYYVCFFSFFFKRNYGICVLREGRTHLFKGKQNNIGKQPEMMGRSLDSTGLSH